MKLGIVLSDGTMQQIDDVEYVAINPECSGYTQTARKGILEVIPFTHWGINEND